MVRQLDLKPSVIEIIIRPEFPPQNPSSNLPESTSLSLRIYTCIHANLKQLFLNY